MKRLVLLAAAAAVLPLTGCTADAGPPENPFAGSQTPASSVDVDTPALRELKHESGIEACPATDPASTAVDNGLPDITLPCLGGGRPVHLAGLRGRPTVLNLWASWCTPCREELPVLQDFYQRADGKVRMLGVDFEDTQPEAALKLLEASGVTYPQVADFDKAIDEGLGRHPVPMTVLLNADGEVVTAMPTQITSVDQLAGLVEESLGVQV